MQLSQKRPRGLPPQPLAQSERFHPWFPGFPPPILVILTFHGEAHPPLGGQSPVYRAPPTPPPQMPHHRPSPPNSPTLRGLTSNLPAPLPEGATHRSPSLPRLPSHCGSPCFPAAPPPIPCQMQIVKELDSHIGFCCVGLFCFFVFGAPPAGSPAHLLGSRPPPSGFIRPPALLLRGIPLFSWSRPMRAPGFLSASARLEPNLTRQQPIPHALQTRDREQYELGGCPRPNVVFGSVHDDPLAAAPAFAKKGSWALAR